MMLSQDVQSVRVRIPRDALPRSSDAHGFSLERRDLTRHLRGIAALRALGVQAVPEVVYPSGAPITDAQSSMDVADVEACLRALAAGPAAHARQTIDHVAAESRGDDDEVSRVLSEVYQAHAEGRSAEEVLDSFLDRIDPWLTRIGIPRVDRLFDGLDLHRAPESIGLLLLATTRVTRSHFARRDAFADRLAAFLLGRAGRTEIQVVALLRGLRA